MAHSYQENATTKEAVQGTIKAEALDIPTSETSSQDDDRALDRYGYKAELERRFGFWSMMGLSCTIMITWEGWFAVAGVGLTNGGLAGCIWGFLFVWVGYTAVVACLAELISMIPTAGGQYHWVYELAPPQWKKFVSWTTGWQTVCAWQAGLASCFCLSGTIIQSLVILNWPDYAPQRWQATLMMWAIILISTLLNTLFVKLLPAFEGAVLTLHIASYLVVLVPLVHFGSYASASDVFTQFTSLGGYSTGVSFFVGLVTTVFAFIGADGAIHMCEEVRNARTVVPNVLMASTCVNGVLGFAMVIAVMFTIGDPAAALVSETGYLFIDYFARTLNSHGFATALTTILLVLFLCGATSLLASTSRVTWAFARDDGMPGSSWIKKVSPSFRLPINAILLSGLISLLLSLIEIGSYVAFNALVSLVVSAFYGSYAVPIGIVAYKRATNQPLELGPWNLGRFGLLINIFSLIYLTITWIFSFFPIAIPVDAESMNWSSTLWGIMTIFGTVWYFARQRHIFTGPAVVVGHLDLR